MISAASFGSLVTEQARQNGKKGAGGCNGLGSIALARMGGSAFIAIVEVHCLSPEGFGTSVKAGQAAFGPLGVLQRYSAAFRLILYPFSLRSSRGIVQHIAMRMPFWFY